MEPGLEERGVSWKDGWGHFKIALKPVYRLPRPVVFCLFRLEHTHSYTWAHRIEPIMRSMSWSWSFRRFLRAQERGEKHNLVNVLTAAEQYVWSCCCTRAEKIRGRLSGFWNLLFFSVPQFSLLLWHLVWLLHNITTRSRLHVLYCLLFLPLCLCLLLCSSWSLLFVLFCPCFPSPLALSNSTILFLY